METAGRTSVPAKIVPAVVEVAAMATARTVPVAVEVAVRAREKTAAPEDARMRSEERLSGIMTIRCWCSPAICWRSHRNGVILSDKAS